MLAGGFDGVYGIATGEQALDRRGRITRRDLLLQVAELDLHARLVDRASRTRGRGLTRRSAPSTATTAATDAAARNSTDPTVRDGSGSTERHALAEAGVWARASAQSQAPRPVVEAESVQLTLELGDEPGRPGERTTGLPEMTTLERMRAELEILGLDVSQHAVTPYASLLDALGVTRSRDLLRRRSRSELFVAGVKVATQTPPIRSGRRVVFLTLDDGTGPVDATFFEDAQGPYAATVFSSWLLLVRGELRRTGRRGVSLRATGAWDLPALHALWQRARTTDEALEQVRAELARRPEPLAEGAGEPTGRRALVHSSGFRLSPYADVAPAGDPARDVGRKLGAAAGADARVGDRPPSRTLWHRSPGSPG